jgi:hypothetical protein
LAPRGVVAGLHIACSILPPVHRAISTGVPLVGCKLLWDGLR